MKDDKALVYLMVVGLLALVMAGSGCSTAVVRVMPLEDGSVRINAKDSKKEKAEEAAVDAAREYCEKRQLDAIFLSEKSKYTGEMEEGTRKNVQNASTAAMILGGFGSPVSQAGGIGATMTSGKDYEADVVIKCERRR